jgi:hypothetical protein
VEFSAYRPTVSAGFIIASNTSMHGFLYGMMTLNWATVKDFKQFLEFRAKGINR